MATPQGNTVALTGEERLDYLLQGSVWQLAPDRMLTYSLDLNFDGPLQSWDGTWSALVAQGLAAWEAVANIHFVQVGAANAQAQNESSADIAIALSPDGESPIAGLSLFPDPLFADLLLEAVGYSRDGGQFPYPRPEGDITFNPTLIDSIAGIVPGSIALEIVLHEIGHALGLKHVDDGGGNDRPIGTLSNQAYPSLMWSMSASDGVNLTAPTVYDIQAIQHLYGANTTYRTGNDTYSLEPRSYTAIWDAGGNDTVVRGNSTESAEIDLRAGAGSGTAGWQKNLWIAYGVTIENAVGGAGADRITGNAAANELSGGGGADWLSGGAGADSVAGGSGNDLVEGSRDGDALQGDSGVDTLNGGAGGDVLDGGDDRDELYGDEGADKLIGGAGIDHLTGGEGADTLLGGEGFDTLEGGDGNDRLAGGGRDDKYLVTNSGDTVHENPGEGQDSVEASVSFTLSDNVEVLTLLGTDPLSGIGSDGADAIFGNRAANHLLGQGGADTLRGQEGDDTLEGGAGADLLDAGYSGRDHLVGGAGDDSLYGGQGADYLDGGTGNDAMDGGDGDDVYIVDSAGDEVHDGSYTGGHDIVQSRVSFELPDAYTGVHIEDLVLIGGRSIDGKGNALGNTINGNEAANTLDGGGERDRLFGNGGNDTLLGGQEADSLWGGDGADWLEGGAGLDRMAGGRGDDVYVLDSALAEVGGYIDGIDGEYVTGGTLLDLGPATGSVEVTKLLDPSGDGLVDQLQLTYSRNGSVVWSLEFRTDVAGGSLEPGDYVDATVFASTGHPFLGVQIGLRSLTGYLSTISGSFHVDEAAFDYSGDAPLLLSFAASFEFNKGAESIGWGEVQFDSVGATEAVIEKAGEGFDTVRSGASAKLSANVEQLVLTGHAAADGTGNAQDNILVGNDAANVLDGGGGHDTLSGGGGADSFAFSSMLDAAGNVDLIADFSPAEDFVVLDSAIFDMLGAGALADGQFVMAADPLAADGDDLILYDTESGALYYDSDGNGALDRVQFAALSGAPALMAGNITVG
jgi:Ca2+-binding RTX toxin-like protein